MPAQDLRRLLSGVIDSVAASDSRPELAGAYVQLGKTHITAAATDSFRLVECSVPSARSEEHSIIIPRTAVTEALRVLGDAAGEVLVRAADNQLMISGDGYELVSRLIDGRYPEYRKVIPEKHLAKALVRREDLENAIRVAALFSSSIADVKISCTEKTLTVSAKNASKGEGEATVEANLKGEPFEISLNYHYLLDGMKAIPEEKVILQFTGKGSPFVIRPSSEDPAVYIIMPLRG
jgi:DNA polymerase-3 subunit beta